MADYFDVLLAKNLAGGGGGGGGTTPLYAHHIFMKVNNPFSVFLTVIRSDNTPFTISTLYAWLKDNDFTSVEKGYGVTGSYSSAAVVAIYATETENTFGVWGVGSSTSSNSFSITQYKTIQIS